MNKLRHQFVLFLLCLLLFSSSLKASAQKPESKLFRVGIKLTPNYSWVKYKTQDYIANSQSPGIAFGFISDYLISDDFMVKTGFDFYTLKLDYTMPYSMTVDESYQINYTGSLHRKAKLNYFEIPITLKYLVVNSNKFSVNAQLGLKFGFNFRSKADEDFTYVDLDMKHQTFSRSGVNINEEIAGFKMALVVGGGVEYNIYKNVVIFCSLLVNPGITNIMSGFNTTNTNILNKATANSIELSIGFII
ncbi:MAG: PorT family protein [Bacteroidales bacterium]|jgi:hypothetical protein|nr:PorT family protein [Bacteroidales bacterium]